MIAAIVLAAGMSVRMGTLKQLLPFGDTTMLDAVVRNLREARVDKLLVVLGHEAERVRESVTGAGAEFVLNPDYPRGMFTSVQAGLRVLPPAIDTFLICLGDQPAIPGNTIRTLLDTFLACGKGIGIPFARNDQGHPLFVAGKYLNEIRLMAPTLTLKHFLAAHGDDISRLPIQDDSVLRDIDTHEDYELERRRFDCDI